MLYLVMDKKQYAPLNWVREVFLVIFFGLLVHFVIIIPMKRLIETQRRFDSYKLYRAKRMKAISDRDSLMHINRLPE